MFFSLSPSLSLSLSPSSSPPPNASLHLTLYCLDSGYQLPSTRSPQPLARPRIQARQNAFLLPLHPPPTHAFTCLSHPLPPAVGLLLPFISRTIASHLPSLKSLFVEDVRLVLESGSRAPPPNRPVPKRRLHGSPAVVLTRGQQRRVA